MTIGWGAIALLLAGAAFVFWLGRTTASGDRTRGDLSGAPNAMIRPAPPSPAAPAAPRPQSAVPHGMAALSPQQYQMIRDEMEAGRKISAIKMLRDATGLGLAEAKNAVEAMEV